MRMIKTQRLVHSNQVYFLNVDILNETDKCSKLSV